MTAQLYRHFDAEGRLLYVGISLSALRRLAQHRYRSHWFWRIARIEISNYPTRSQAIAAERTAIQTENPLHNGDGLPPYIPVDGEEPPGTKLMRWHAEQLAKSKAPSP